MGKKLQIKTELQLPGLLDAVSSSLSSGCTLLQSLETAAAKIPRPLEDYMQGLIASVRAGSSLDQAMERLASGLPGGSFSLALYAMAASYRSGGNMIHSLTQISRICREREILRQKIRARTAQSRMQGTVLILVPFIFMLLGFVTAPQTMLPVFHSPVGRGLLLAALCLQVVGSLVVRRMLKQDILG